MKKIQADILPLLLSLLLSLYSFWVSQNSDLVFTQGHYVGLGALGVASLLYFTNRKFYTFFFALTLVVGLIGYLDFYITRIQIGFAEVGINPIFLGLFLFFLVMSNRTTASKKIVLNEKLVASYETKYNHLSEEELRAIADVDSKYTAEAKEAANRLLSAKKSQG